MIDKTRGRDKLYDMTNQPGKYIETKELTKEDIGAKVMHAPSRREGIIKFWDYDGCGVDYNGVVARTKFTDLVWGREDPNAPIK